MSYDLMISIGANLTGLHAGIAQAQAYVRSFNDEVAKNEKKRRAIDDLGTSFGKVGLLAAGGLAVSAKAAVDWESQFAGVRKTVGGTADETARLEDQLRGMARSMPASHQEIAATAQAAGALGVEQKNVAGFTRTMIMLGEATDDLTPDQAATGMAQFMNVMRTGPKDVDNLSSSLVALGNNGASTEGQILQMAQNIAGAGKTVGLAETDVLGIANALASVGIDPEAGGSAVSNVLIDMSKAAKTNGKEMKVWAATAGMSISDFQRSMRDDPAEAFVAFTKGLGRVKDEGGDVFSLMESLGQSDIRVTRALLGMANSGDLLTDSLQTSSDAFEKNTALSKEYATRSETAGAQAEIAWNGVKDNLIDIGNDALPVIKELSQGVSELTGWFSDLPDGAKTSVLAILGVTAAVGGSVFAISKAVTGYANLRNTMADLRGKTSELDGATSALTKRQMATRGGALALGVGLTAISGKVGETNEALGMMTNIAGSTAAGFAVGGPWGAGIGFAIGALTSFGGRARVAAADVDALTDSLNQQSGALTENSRQLIVNALNKDPDGKGKQKSALGEARSLGVDPGDVVDASLGNQKAMDRIIALRERRAAEAQAEAFATNPATAGSADDAARKQFDRLTDAITEQGGAIDRSRAQLRDHNDAVAGSIEMNRLSGAEIRKVTRAVRGLPREAATKFTTPGYKDAVGNAVNIARRYKLTPKQVETALRALDYSSDQIAAVKRLMNDLDGDTATVRVDAAVEAARAAIMSIPGVGAPIGARINVTRSVTEVSGGKPSGGSKGSHQARGSILDFYADGGLRESHVAQIAPAGAWRVFAEPETGGEAYIPLAPSKRDRSLDIWAETGRRLGVAGYGDGGMAGGAVASRRGPGGGSGTGGVRIPVHIKGEGALAELIDERVLIRMDENEEWTVSQEKAGRR